MRETATVTTLKQTVRIVISRMEELSFPDVIKQVIRSMNSRKTEAKIKTQVMPRGPKMAIVTMPAKMTYKIIEVGRLNMFHLEYGNIGTLCGVLDVLWLVTKPVIEEESIVHFTAEGAVRPVILSETAKSLTRDARILKKKL